MKHLLDKIVEKYLGSIRKDSYNEGWGDGYSVGFDAGYADGVRKAMIIAQRNTLNNRKGESNE